MPPLAFIHSFILLPQAHTLMSVWNRTVTTETAVTTILKTLSPDLRVTTTKMQSTSRSRIVHQEPVEIGLNYNSRLRSPGSVAPEASEVGPLVLPQPMNEICTERDPRLKVKANYFRATRKESSKKKRPYPCKKQKTEAVNPVVVVAPTVVSESDDANKR